MSEFVGAPAGATVTSNDVKSPASVGTHITDSTAENFGSKLAVNKDSVSQKLAKIMPSRTPIDSVLRNIGTANCKSDKYRFFSLASRDVAAVVKTANEATADTKTATTIALSSGVHCLSLDSNLFIPSVPVTDGKPGAQALDKVFMRPLVVNVVAIDYAKGEISVVGTNAYVPALKQGTVLYRMAAAKDQDAAISNDPQSTPTDDFNFCQRNLCTISQNAFQKLQEKEVQFSMAEMKEQALFDFRWQAEMSTIFGGGAVLEEKFKDPTTLKRKLQMRGIVDFDIQEIDFSQGEFASLDIAEKLNHACEDVFAGNNGSEERLFIYGPEVATMMANSAVWQKRMDAAKTEVKWGVKWKLIETNFGTLRGIMQPGFGLLGGYSKCALIIDPANIRRVEQVPLNARNLDLKAAGLRNSEDIVLEEAWTLEVTNPKTHAFVKFA